MGVQSQLTVYRSSSPVVDTWYEPGTDQTVGDVIIEALADAESMDGSEIEPIYGSIDLDALSKLVESCGETDRNTIVSFTHENWNVFVRADGRIRVCDNTRQTDPKPVFEGRPA